MPLVQQEGIEMDVLDDRSKHQWETEINIESEKQKAFGVLANFVSHSEIYFNNH